MTRITNRTGRPSPRPGNVSDSRTDQWPDIIEEPSDQSGQPSASCWVAGRTPHCASDQVSMNVTESTLCS